jgi:hypothetical protein
MRSGAMPLGFFISAAVLLVHPVFPHEKKIESGAVAGSILGIVVPFSVKTTVFAISVSDTMAFTITDTTNGAYILKDVPPGNYALVFIPSDPSYNKNSCRAAVSEGQITIADTIRLQK